MASVEEVRAGIQLANQKAAESIAALQQAGQAIEQAQGALINATQGSAQSDAEQASGLLAQAVSTLGDVARNVTAAISTAEGYAARL
jgi:hypothetical protein